MKIPHLAIASVPLQSWGPLYDSRTALRKGTVFQELDMPFYAADEDITDGCSCQTSGTDDPEQRTREEKMLQIYQVCFFVDDLRLYLDTHPQDAEARSLLKDHLDRRKQCMKEFAQDFFPLTMDCMTEVCAGKTGAHGYCWQEGPMPWEGACV